MAASMVSYAGPRALSSPSLMASPRVGASRQNAPHTSVRAAADPLAGTTSAERSLGFEMSQTSFRDKLD
jgi:hypothetical protein